MDFGTGKQPENKTDTNYIKKQIKELVEKELGSDNLDQRKIYQKITNLIGEENIDSQMLVFAIRRSVEKINQLKKNSEDDILEFNRAVGLIVDWSLIKLKSKTESTSKLTENDIKIGSNQPNGSTIDSLL